MRKLFALLCLILFLGLTVPTAQAQLRQDVPSQQAPAQLYSAEGSTFSLNKLFSPEHFRMQHSYEMSMSSFGGNTSSMGMYTNSLLWQFSNKLAARVDVGVAHQLFGQNNFGGHNLSAFGVNDGPQVFLRNAEVLYKPSENVRLHFQMRQSPYGRYADPYGYGGYHGSRAQDFFWNE